MSARTDARELIASLSGRETYAECPQCGEEIHLADAGLFYLDDRTPKAEELYRERSEEVASRRRELMEARKKKPKASEITTKAVNVGKMVEQIVPSFSQFGFLTGDCRSLFDPIDYLIFEGLAAAGSVKRLVFADVKTGAAGLSARQKEIKSLIERNRVEWDTYEPEG